MTGGRLILLRHGESTANRDGLFTGVLDVPLSSVGRGQSRRAGSALVDADIPVDTVFTSTMRRAFETVDELRLCRPPLVLERTSVFEDGRLNERNYGALTGRAKHDVLEEVGDAQYLEWRRSYDVAPPPMTPDEFAALLPRAAPGSADLGLTESLHDVVRRVHRFTDERLRPPLLAGKTVLVVAHGNSLRALCVVLDGLTPAEVASLNLPTGYPLMYSFTDDGRPVVHGGSFLDPDAASAASSLIAEEGGT